MMRNLFATALCVVFCAAATATAQDGDFRTARNRVGDVDYVVTNYGIFGHDVAAARPGFTYPRGSGHAYLYGSGIWFGAMKVVGDTLRPLAFMGFNPNSGESWATPGDPAPASDKGLYYAGDYDHLTGAFAGTGSADAWPLWSATGARVTPRAPGIFVADVAARHTGGGLKAPAFMPGVDEQFVTRFHDGDLGRYEGFGSEFGFPIGLQFQQAVYSWSPWFDYGSTVVIQYEIVNISADTLRQCVVGQASDPDLGSANNDRVAIYRGSDGRVRAGVVTTARETGEFEALAEILIEAPSIGANGFIDNSLRAAELTEHEIHTWRNWSLESDPTTLAERYAWMLGPAQESDTIGGDKRTMLATRPFNMAPGDTAHFAMAFAIVPPPTGRANGGSTGLLSVNPGAQDELDALIAALVRDFADGDFSPASPSAVRAEASPAARLRVAPNPAADGARVAFSLERGGTVELTLVDALGRRVAATTLGELGAGAHTATIDLAGIAPGTYVVAVDAEGLRRTTLLTVTR